MLVIPCTVDNHSLRKTILLTQAITEESIVNKSISVWINDNIILIIGDISSNLCFEKKTDFVILNVVVNKVLMIKRIFYIVF
jgi:hypothetical protein